LLACAITVIMAWPVVLAPSRLVYGDEIVGRQADLHAVISQFSNATAPELLPQALTLAPGAALSRAFSPVTALNIVVLWTFPLTALATFALAWYLHRSILGASVAALAFTFSPMHLAQAAYHPYTAQIQWIPLYFLALIALVDRVSAWRIAALVAASAALILSNDEAALMAAVVTPVVIVAFWAIRPDVLENYKPLIWPFAIFATVLTAAGVVAFWLEPSVFSRAYMAQFPIKEIALFSARWWAYFTPSVDHPVLGSIARNLFGRFGINVELLEQQIFVGFAFTALAIVGLGVAAWTWRPEWRYVLAIGAVGLAAALVSVGPATGSCEPFSIAPSCLLFRVVPVFRVYARFAVIVNLAVAIAAGAGAAMLASASRTGQVSAAVLLVVGAFEFWPLPVRAHDVLPTAAHRWLASQSADGPAFDCYPANRADRFVPWLMQRQLSYLGDQIKTCSDPEIGRKLAALGYTRVIVRNGEASSKLPQPLPTGLALAHDFPDSHVFAIDNRLPPVVTIALNGFFEYEHQKDYWWRWMSPNGRWTVRNTTNTPQTVALAVELVPIGTPRTLTMRLDGQAPTSVSLGMTRQPYTLGPWTLQPGDHTLSFTADGEPIRPSDQLEDSKDTRPLTVAFSNERWVAAQ
jgi:hypothetical protein